MLAPVPNLASHQRPTAKELRTHHTWLVSDRISIPIWQCLSWALHKISRRPSRSHANRPGIGKKWKKPWEKPNDEERHPCFMMQWIRNSKRVSKMIVIAPYPDPFCKFFHTMEDTSGQERNSVDLERTRAFSWVVKGDQSVKVITWVSYIFFNSIYSNLSASECHSNLFLFQYAESRFTVCWHCELGMHVDVSHLANQTPALLALPRRGCKLNSVLSVTKSGAFYWTNI